MKNNMKNFTNYSNLAETLITTINKDCESYANIEKCSVSQLDKMLGLKVSTELGGTKGKAIRMIFKIFGLAISSGTVVSHVNNAKEIILIVNQVAPIVKYFSRDFIKKIASRFSSEKTVDSSNSMTIFKFIKALAYKNKLTDYLMESVTDRQFEIASKNEGKTDSTKSASCGFMKTDLDTIATNKEAALKEEVQRLRKQLDKRNVNSGSDELFIERLEDSIVSVAPSLKFISEPWHGDKTFNHNESATEVLHISDWHIGEVDNIGGLNQFNYEIACERVKTLTNKVISWTKMHRSMYTVDELVIIATGDMISGDIHDELRATNEFPAPEQCVKSAMLISKMANELSSIFKKVRIEYIVADNHSRTTKKMEFAPGTNSYNYIVGTMSQIMLRDNKNIEFNLYPEIEHIIKVEGLNYLITHGNSIRGGQLGLPYYGMTRRLGAEALIRMNMPEDSHFNRIVMGHYHTPMMTNGIEMTGCLSSTTAFDHASGRHSRACQSAWLVSKTFEMDYSIFWLS